jgi:ParD-like antitoxin of type II bacterial toxin-antitoxin system
MPAPVKVSDRLLVLARQEARDAHRSLTAQIEHWATLGRAVEVLLSYSDVLALKRTGQALPLPVRVHPDEVHARLASLGADPDRGVVRARIRAAGPVYEAAEEPGLIAEVRPDGRRILGRMEGRRFVPVEDAPTG